MPSAFHKTRHNRFGGRLRNRNRLSWLTLIALIAAVLIRLVYPAARQPGQVVRVLDGDSLAVLQEEREVEVRLFAIDCPEKGQPYAGRARERTRELALGQVVERQVMDVDRYGREVCEVTLPDGRRLSEELVREGLAWSYPDHVPPGSALPGLESRARQAGRGLWQDADPEPPWVYRNRRRQ